MTEQDSDTRFGITSREGRLRVLVVEDETLLSLSLEGMLEEWGHEIVGSVASGGEAVRTAIATAPDVVLMDINLAGEMNGLTAATQIRALCEDVVVVFMTAYSDLDLGARPEIGAAEVLRKPFSPRRLRAVLSAISLADDGAGASALPRRRGDGADSR